MTEEQGDTIIRLLEKILWELERELNPNVERAHSALGDIKSDVSAIQEDVSRIQSGVDGIQSDVASIALS